MVHTNIQHDKVGKCSKIQTKVASQEAIANSADPEQNAPEGEICVRALLFAILKSIM